MSVIEDVLVEEIVRNAETQDTLFKLRATVYKEYDRLDPETLDDLFDESNYTAQTEDGYVGFAPVG